MINQFQSRLLICLVTASSLVGCTRRSETEALREQIAEIQTQNVTLREENAALEAQLKDDRKARESLIARISEMEAQIKKSTEETNQREAAQKVLEWNAQIDKILAILERAKNEDDAFSLARSESDFVTEEQRLKSLARQQETSAQLIVGDLTSAGFPDSAKLKREIENFTYSYGYYVSYTKMAFREARSTGTVQKEIEENQKKFMGEFYQHLLNIRALKVKQNGPNRPSTQFKLPEVKLPGH